ncbi:hypothetical protein A6A27_31775 [Micromonospora sp. CB01531]|nr:hypothetical protein A6A27_31775 [Micromonospora sp. CB01531]
MKNEAQDAVVVFEFRGRKYKLPANLNEADGDVLEHYENDKPISALKALLGEDQFAEYKASVKPKVKDHIEFIGEAFKALGTTSGE